MEVWRWLVGYIDCIVEVASIGYLVYMRIAEVASVDFDAYSDRATW